MLQELRFITSEVGSLSDSMGLPREVRRWWITEMQKEQEPKGPQQPLGPRTIVKDVPRGPRG